MSRAYNSKPNRTYTKVFRDEQKAEKAKNMLLSGYKLKEIARVFNVDHTSILSLKKRYEQDGVIFPQAVKLPDRGPEFDETIPPTPDEFRHMLAEEQAKYIKAPRKKTKYEDVDDLPLNQGKSYVEYLKDYNNRVGPLVEARMAMAKKTINELHEQRKKSKEHWSPISYDTSVY